MSRPPAVPGPAPRAFPGASCGSDVVPGRVVRVLDVACQLGEISDGLLRFAALMQSIAPPGWRGAAARWFQQVLSVDSRPVGRAGAVLAQAAEHLREHAAVLDHAQRRADDAVRTDLQAARVSAEWANAGAVGQDPMAATRSRLASDVATVRARVRASAAEASAALRLARDLAPDPSPASRLLHRVDDTWHDVETGLVKGTLDLTPTILSGVTMLWDPAGGARRGAAQARDLAVALRDDPAQVGRAVLDLDTWDENRAAWTASLVPGVALAAATGGSASATRASTFTARGLSVLPTKTGVALRAAIREREQYGRAGLKARDVRPYVSSPSELGTVTRLAAVPHAVARATARDAAFAERITTAKVERVADRLDGVRVKDEYVLKAPDSLNRKFADELGTAPSASSASPASPGSVARRLNDTVRYTIVYPDAVYASKAADTVTGLREEGLALVKAKSTWDGHRYRGLNITVRDPGSGRLLEVQAHTAESFRAGEDTRDAYELFRDAGIDPHRKALLERFIGDRYRQVPTPPGVDELPGALARMGQDAPATSAPPRVVGFDPRRQLPTPLVVAVGSSTTRGSVAPAEAP